jgi:hypothetical protein
MRSSSRFFIISSSSGCEFEIGRGPCPRPPTRWIYTNLMHPTILQMLPMVKGRSAKLPGGLCCVKGEKSAEEHYEEAAGRNAYSVARSTSPYHGCMLEAGRAFNATSSCVFHELSSDVWTGRVKEQLVSMANRPVWPQRVSSGP